MFCRKCGYDLPDDSKFCPKCGNEVILTEHTPEAPKSESYATNNSISQVTTAISEPEASAPVHELIKVTSDEATAASSFEAAPQSAIVPTLTEQGSGKKNKAKIPRIALIIGIIVIVVATTIFVIVNWTGKIDYVASVKTWVPFGSSGISATCGTVFDKYITSCTWTKDALSDSLVSVDASGTVKNTDGNTANIAVKIEVTPGNTSDTLAFKIAWGKLGDQTLTAAQAQQLVADMFDAYDQRFSSLADYYISDSSDSFASMAVNGTLSQDVDSSSTGSLASLSDIYAAYDTILAQYGYDPIAMDGTDTDNYTVRDIIGDSTPELVIWVEWDGAQDTKDIYGYDATTGTAFQYSGDTFIRYPSKGKDGYCLNFSGSGGMYGGITVYEASRQQISQVHTFHWDIDIFDMSVVTYTIDSQEVNENQYTAELSKYSDDLYLPDNTTSTTEASTSPLVTESDVYAAYDKILVQYGLGTIAENGTDTSDYSVEDIIGGSTPELVIWAEQYAPGIDTEAIFGYDKTTRSAFQYNGSEQIRNPYKGNNGYCISQEGGMGLYAYITVYEVSGRQINSIHNFGWNIAPDDMTKVTYTIDNNEVSKNQYVIEYSKYSYYLCLPDLSEDDDMSQNQDGNNQQAKQIGPTRLKADADDFADLENLLENIHLLPLVGFNVDQNDAEFVLINILQGSGSFEGYDYYFGITNHAYTLIDPLNKFGGMGIELPANNMDWILTNIFHLTPDHSVNDSLMYYYNGKYYFYGGLSGFTGMYASVNQYEQMADGRYSIICDLYDDEYDAASDTLVKANTPFETISITSDLVQIDGEKYWTFYDVYKIDTTSAVSQ